MRRFISRETASFPDMSQDKTEGKPVSKRARMQMYDQGFKKVVHNADVLSWILRDCVGPFKGMEIGEIRKCLDIGENGRVRGLEQEFSSEENGPVIMDNVFLVRLPGSEGKIAVMVDVEGQSGSAGPARSMQRAVCYLSRMIESQKGRGDDPYRNILPVFGIWIDFNAPACEANTMAVYNGFPLPESDGPLSGMSLLNLVRVRIGRGEVAEGVNVMSLFGTIVSSGSGGADAVKPELAITKIFIGPEEKYVIVNHDLPWTLIRDAVQYANDRIHDNLPVRKATMSRDDPELEKVRIKLDRIGEDEEITVVSIGDIDYSACSGVHVMETSEIEMIMVDRKVSAGKDGFAIHFKVGKAARDSAADLANLCLQVIDECSSKPQDILRTVANMKKDLAAAAEASKGAAKQAIASLVPEDINGTKVYHGVFPGADRKTVTEGADRFAAEGGVCAFISTGDSVSVILTSGSSKVDCKVILGECLAKYGGRGGGKPALAQGGIPDSADAEKLMQDMLSAVRSRL